MTYEICYWQNGEQLTRDATQEESTEIDARKSAALANAGQELISVVVAATQARLDAFAQTRNYDGILSACTYANSTVVQFAKEGTYAVTARDNTWSTLYTILAEVKAGTRPMPTGYADVEPLLPALAWPV